MVEPQGRVLRWDYTGEFPKLFYLSDLAAPPMSEEWTQDIREALIFATFCCPQGTAETDADHQAKALKDAGVTNVFAVVVSTDEAVIEERAKLPVKPAAQQPVSRRSLDSRDAYEETCRRLGERVE